MNTGFNEQLNLFKMIYGQNVMCTNGLFHIIDNEHNEVYINSLTKELDKRGKYNTIAVTDNIVIAKVANNEKIKFVILSKKDLHCIYKTSGTINYIDENISYSIRKEKVTIISHTGKILYELNDMQKIEKLYGRVYIISSSCTFNDRIIQYSKHRDRIVELTRDKKYTIYKTKDSKSNSSIDILSMNGGRYRYDLRTHECINLFTNKQEKLELWSIT